MVDEEKDNKDSGLEATGEPKGEVEGEAVEAELSSVVEPPEEAVSSEALEETPSEAGPEGEIAGAATRVSTLTMISRVFGYLRDAVIASFFGAGFYADSFFVAFRVSNLLRRLVGEGALTSSFIPIFKEELRIRTKEEARILASKVFTLFFIILFILTVVGILMSEPLIRLMAPGFTEDSEKFALTVNLTRFMFPYMIFIGMMAIAMGVLNSLKHFTGPAISPIFLNISISLATVFISPYLAEPVYALAMGVLVGGFLQFAIQLPYLRRFDMTPGVVFDFRDTAIRKIFLLMGPAALGVGVYQLNIFITLWFASTLADGSISYLYYASRLVELPLGIFGVALATAILPNLSEYASKKDYESFLSSLSYAIRMILLVVMPAAFGLLVLGYPIIDILFLRGEFGREAAQGTVIALYFYAIGVVPIATSRVLLSVYYSTKDTLTPALIALFSLVVNVILCVLLIGPLKHGGLALATSLSEITSFTLLMLILRRRYGAIGVRPILVTAGKALMASIVMTIFVYGAIEFVVWDSRGVTFKAATLFSLIFSGAAVYFMICAALKMKEVSFLREICVKVIGKK